MAENETARRIEMNVGAFGGFILGVVYKMPELAIPCLAINGMSFVNSVPPILNYMNWRSEREKVISVAEQITAEAAAAEES